MTMLATNHLSAAFERYLRSCDSIDIAVAWAGPTPALTALQQVSQSRKIAVRSIVGISGNGTHPDALRALQEIGQIRIGTGAPGIFHPKFYRFRSGAKHTYWVGSANFTLGGFSSNFELMYEFSDYGDMGRWFDDLWKSLEKNSEPAIKHYIDNWKREPKPPAIINTPKLKQSPLDLISSGPLSWPAYMSALRKLDSYWRSKSFEMGWGTFSVLGEEWSWLETISTGHTLMSLRDWSSLSMEEINELLGYRSGQGAWGLLGSMRGAGRAVGRFISNDKNVREIIRSSLRDVIEAESQDDFLAAAASAVEEISEQHGFGPAIATRLITFARPDRGVSVNKGSAAGFSSLTSLPITAPVLGNPKNYSLLLKWVYAQPWYSAPEPKNSLERSVWQMRAGLLDCFVYEAV